MTAVAEAEVLPWLPQSWLDGIKSGKYIERNRSKSKNPELRKWAKNRPGGEGEPCKMMQKVVDEYFETAGEDGSVHDYTDLKTYQMCALAYEGHRGLWTALMKVRKQFRKLVSDDRMDARSRGEETGTSRNQDEAAAEYTRLWTGAARLMLGQAENAGGDNLGEGAAACSCWDEPEGLDWDGGGTAGDPYSYPLTDVGNAQQLLDLTGGSLVWSEGHKSWLSYDPDTGMWDGEGVGEGVRAAMLLAPRIAAAAKQRYAHAQELEKAGKGKSSDFENAVKQSGRLAKHAERCGSRSMINASLEMLQSLEGAYVNPNAWDANERLLCTGDGNVVELNKDGVNVRPATREDRMRKQTAVPYVPGATDEGWTSYLETFLPDKELRSWIQQLFGYALYGRNPERLLVFLHGPTSSGKSTIVEAVGAAIGDYGGTFDLSVFRHNIDAGGRPDIIRLMSQRIALASETSFEHPLHNDQLKRLVGGDRISARMLYGNSFIDAIPQFTPFVATNAIPRIEGADQATWRRLLAVPFDEQVFGDDDDTSARDALRTSPSAQAAVLAWCVEGWHAYAKVAAAGGSLQSTAPPTVVLRTMSFRESVSDFHQWLAECIDRDPEAFAPVNDLYNNYRSWCAENSIDRIMSLTAFGSKLGGEGFEKSRPKIDGNKVYVRHGLRLSARGT